MMWEMLIESTFSEFVGVFLLKYFFSCLKSQIYSIFFSSVLIFLNICVNIMLLIFYYWFFVYFLPSKNFKDIYRLLFSVLKWVSFIYLFYLIKYSIFLIYEINFLSKPLMYVSSFLVIFYIFFIYFLFRKIIYFFVPSFFSKYPKLFFNLNYFFLYLTFICTIYFYYHYTSLNDTWVKMISFPEIWEMWTFNLLFEELFFLKYFFACFTSSSYLIFFSSFLIFFNTFFNILLLILYYWFFFNFLPCKKLKDIYSLFFYLLKLFFSILYFYFIKSFIFFVFGIIFFSNPLLYLSSFIVIFYILFIYFLCRNIIFYLAPSIYSQYPRLFLNLDYFRAYLIFVGIIYVYYHGSDVLYECVIGEKFPEPLPEDKAFIDFLVKNIPDIEEILEDDEFLEIRPDLKGKDIFDILLDKLRNKQIYDDDEKEE